VEEEMNFNIKQASRKALTAVLLLIAVTVIGFSQIPVNYISQFDSGDQSERAIGLGYQNYGPYTALGRVWVFYSTGTDAVYRTKQAESGGQWTTRQSVFPLNSGYNKFGVAFDGTYFHFVRSVAGNLRYRRGEANRDGSITFGSEVTIFEDPSWKVQSADIFSIIVDYRGMPWVTASVESGANKKAIALSSIDNSGGWENRPNWPKDLVTADTDVYHGQGVQAVEINDGRILFAFRHSVIKRMTARLWTEDAESADAEGTLGQIETTPLENESARTSMVSPASNIALLNIDGTVARRNSDGSWTTVTPPGMNTTFWNSMSVKGDTVRIWDIGGSDVRYRQSSNYGDNWGAIISISAPGAVQAVATDPRGSHGDHHSVMWMTNTSGDPFTPPFNLFMLLEGTVPEPGKPQLISPSDGSNNLPKDVTFIWNRIENANSYTLQVSTESDFSTTVVNESGISDTSRVITDLPLNLSYYWRVKAVTLGGTESEWSTVWDFETVGIPPAPVLISPVNDAVDQLTALTLSWNPAAGAETYTVQVATMSDFSSTFVNQSDVTATSLQIDGLDAERTYYWRVRARNEFGDGNWSQVWNFTTRTGIPAAPALTSPENESINVATSLQVQWQASPGADSYRVQLSTVQDFSSTVLNVGSITGMSHQVNGLNNSTTYYWRVNATNESGTSSWSTVWSFTTIIAVPDVPVLTAPAHQATGVSTKPLLDWNAANRAETYQVQVASDTVFNSIVLNVDEIDSTSYWISEELEPFTTYYWRVNAENIGGTSGWSTIFSFTTGQAFPVAPTLVSPANGGTEVVNALMLWNAVATATQYRLQISTSSDFASTIVDNASITNTFFEATNLQKFTQYYWRVRAISEVGAGDWSATWSFTTGDIVSVERFGNEIPKEFALGQNYPNPFNPATSIRFALPSEATVRLEVYNMLGQKVATLIDGQHFNAGVFEAVWNARDDAGREVSSGIYIYRISAGDHVDLKRMILMK
jgi:fibronectin type 3 domain-containing protein